VQQVVPLRIQIRRSSTARLHAGCDAGCAAQGGDLASIHSEEEWTAARSACKEGPEKTRLFASGDVCYIGLFRQLVNSTQVCLCLSTSERTVASVPNARFVASALQCFASPRMGGGRAARVRWL
jgi:hypothetical protein